VSEANELMHSLAVFTQLVPNFIPILLPFCQSGSFLAFLRLVWVHVKTRPRL